jgi:hypothetical protein
MVQAIGPQAMDQALHEMTPLLRERYKILPGLDDDFTVRNLTEVAPWAGAGPVLADHRRQATSPTRRARLSIKPALLLRSWTTARISRASRWNSRTCSALRRKIAADAKVTSRLAGRSIPRQVEAERQIPGKAQPGWVSRFVNVRSVVCELKVGYRVVLHYSATVLVEDDDDRIRFLSGRHLRTGREKFNN